MKTNHFLKIVIVIAGTLFFNFTINRNNEIIVKYISHSKGERKNIEITFSLLNTTNDTIIILKPRPIYKINGNNEGAIFPDFFELNFSPEKILCLYAEFGSSNEVKLESDFVSIPPKESVEFKIISSDYGMGVCDKNAKEVYCNIKYAFNKKVLDKKYFDQYIISKDMTVSEKEKLYELYKRSYQGSFSSGIIKLDLDKD